MTGRKKRLAIFLCLAMLLSVCTPLVTSAAVIPTVGAAVSANNSVKVVSTQAQLNSALTMSGVKQIVIRTDKAAAFEIPKGNYSAKKLVIRAPKAEIENAGTFRSVTIYSVSDQAYTENADHNKIRVLASGGKIVVPAGRTADYLSVVRRNSRVKIVVSGTVQQMDVKKASNLALEVTGSIKKMNVNATSTITVTGDSKDTTIIVNKAARNSRITVSAPATVKLKAATTVTLKKGAENAKLVIPKSSAKAVSYTLVNETDSTLKLNTSSGTKTLANGKSYDGKESGSSGTIITGGGSGGSSGGSGGGNGGGTSKPVEPEKPPVTKKSVPVAAEITGVNSFCVYVDAVEQIDTLKVAISPSIGAITSKGAVSAQTKVFYAKDGKPLHVYGYCYEYATEKAFEQNQEYTVSVEETDQYCFSFKDSTVTAELPEQKTKDEVELEAYADEFKKAFDGMWISIGTSVNNEILAEAIEKKPSTSNPTSPLVKVWKRFEKDGGTIDKVLIQEDVKANKAYPVDITIKRNDIEKTFTCIIGSFDYTTDEGKFLDAKYYIQCRQWNVNVEGECVLNENTTLMPSRVTIVGWQSSNEALISIINSKTAKISLPKIGVEKVTLTASLSLGDKKDSVERVVTLDSGYRVGTYVATARPMDDNKALEVDCTEPDPDGTAFVYEYGNLSYQWYRMPVGSRDASEKIPGMTDKSCGLNVGGETGTYWYYCEVTNTVDGQPSEVSYSNFVRVSFTDNGVVIERV